MKKIALFMAFAALGFTSCSGDDTATVNPAVTTQFVTGSWVEIAPEPQQRTLDFTATTVTATRQDGLVRNWDYNINGNALYFGSPESHEVTVIDSITMKLTNIYIAGEAENGIPQTVTFRKKVMAPAN